MTQAALGDDMIHDNDDDDDQKQATHEIIVTFEVCWSSPYHFFCYMNCSCIAIVDNIIIRVHVAAASSFVLELVKDDCHLVCPIRTIINIHKTGFLVSSLPVSVALSLSLSQSKVRYSYK